jgi:hypothetical protein
VTPGEYTVTLKTGEAELTQSFRIVTPRDVAASQADLDAQHDALLRIHRQVDRTTRALNRMRDLRTQLDAWAKRTRDREDGGEVAAAAEALSGRILEIEKTLFFPALRSDWEVYNHGVRLLDKLTALSADVGLGDYRPTDAAMAVFETLQARIDEQIAGFEALVADDVPGFNRQLAEAQLGAVVCLP